MLGFIMGAIVVTVERARLLLQGLNYSPKSFLKIGHTKHFIPSRVDTECGNYRFCQSFQKKVFKNGMKESF